MAYISMILSLVSSLIAVAATIYVRYNTNKYEIKLKKIESTFQWQLQIDNYYRSISGEKIMQMFDRWMNLLVDMKNIGNMSPEQFNNMIKELMMYGSPRTVQLGAVFMQMIYSSKEAQNNGMLLMYPLASIIASLKRDFTGYNIDPMQLIYMKINDIKQSDLKYSKEYMEKFKKENNI